MCIRDRPITYGYIRMMGTEGLTRATKIAILNANYLAACFKDTYGIVYRGEGVTLPEITAEVQAESGSALPKDTMAAIKANKVRFIAKMFYGFCSGVSL